jgi:membrane associated rhomboid family serine protease
MFVPYATDAPIYHWPFATVGVIAVNVLVFLPMLGMDAEQAGQVYGPLVLHYGWIYPWQWITSNYVHAGFWHLIGNMLILWAFGLIVEGKLGWWKFLLLYNGIGIAECAIEQIVTLPLGEGASTGASSIIFGLIVIAMVWAPSNDLNCFYMFGFHAGVANVPILTYAAASLAIEGVLAAITVFAASSETMASAVTSQVLHLLGAGVGFGVAVAMLKMKLVDCENWDMFSVWKGRHFMTREQLAQEKLTSAEGIAKLEQIRETMLTQIRTYVAAGEPGAALAVHRRAGIQFAGWKLPEPDCVQLIAALRKCQLWNDAVLCMNEYLKHYAERAPLVRLALAQTLLEQLQRPGQALKAIAKIEPATLDANKQQKLKSLYSKAIAAAEEDPYEAVTDEC